jgi:hypothetical protein
VFVRRCSPARRHGGGGGLRDTWPDRLRRDRGIRIGEALAMKFRKLRERWKYGSSRSNMRLCSECGPSFSKVCSFIPDCCIFHCDKEPNRLYEPCPTCCSPEPHDFLCDRVFVCVLHTTQSNLASRSYPRPIQQLVTDVLVMRSRATSRELPTTNVTGMAISLGWSSSSAQLCATSCRKRVSQSSALPRHWRSGSGVDGGTGGGHLRSEAWG